MVHDGVDFDKLRSVLVDFEAHFWLWSGDSIRWEGLEESKLGDVEIRVTFVGLRHFQGVVDTIVRFGSYSEWASEFRKKIAALTMIGSIRVRLKQKGTNENSVTNFELDVTVASVVVVLEALERCFVSVASSCGETFQLLSDVNSSIVLCTRVGRKKNSGRGARDVGKVHLKWGLVVKG